MASTMNSVDHYRDTALDDTVVPTSKSRYNDSNRRESNREWASGENGLAMSNAGQTNNGYDAATGPTISYRGVGANTDPKMHRSFSQRAKGRPFAEEAYAEDKSDNRADSRPQHRSGRSVPESHSVQSSDEPSTRAMANQVSQVIEPRSQRSHRRADSTSQGKSRWTIGSETQGASVAQTPTRSSTVRDVGNQTDEQRRDWAADRSPLQKLEVKLTDISKEEKRARVQEAEMRYRDSQSSQNPKIVREPSERQSRSVSQPLPVTPTAAGRVPRSDLVQQSPSTKPRPTSNMAGNVQGKSQSTSRRGLAAEIPVRQHGLGGQRNVPPPSQQYNEMQVSRDTQPRSSRDPGRAATARQATIGSRPTTSTHEQVTQPTSTQQQQQQYRLQNLPRIEATLVTDPVRDASHQAALQQLTGQPKPTINPQSIPRRSKDSQTMQSKSASNSRTLANRNSPIAVDVSTLAGGDHDFNDVKSTARPQNRVDVTQPQRSAPVVGLGVSSPPTSKSINSHSLDNIDGSKNRQRRSSVSFKEPFDRRRPVDEWKTAQTAILKAEDFQFEPVEAPQPTNGPETYKAWWEEGQSKKTSQPQAQSSYQQSSQRIDDRITSFSPSLHLKCGPLLRYVGLRRGNPVGTSGAGAKEFWRGTVMIVTQDSQCSYEGIPTLRLFSQPKNLLPPPPPLVTGDQLAPEYIDPIAGLTKLSRTGRALYVRPVDHLEEAKDLSRLEDDNGIYEASPSPLDINGSKDATSATTNKRTLDVDGESIGRYKEVQGVRIYADPDRDVTFWRFNIEIELGSEQQHIAYRINKGASVGFWVPAQGQSMNIMFHSCNGFSASVDANSFSGPDPLWRDVLNNHQTRPFHVMIGGGDQVYNDRVMYDTKLFGEWTKIKNAHHKYAIPFSPEMKNELETFYLERYSMWFSQGLFAMANASIPMVNIWDDHDIIDGYGSYPDHFMKSPVFMGLGDIAHKYYLLFQHQTIDAMTEKDEPSWILGKKPGPYIQHVSRSVYMELGKHVAFLGLDGRTERTRHDVLSIDTLEIMLERCRRDMVEGQTKHLIVLLGVPIAYPRLVWLENILTSKALDPIKALHRAGIVNTKLLNRFDGGVEILDDLDDHWTATHHKDERNILIQDLQDLAAEKSARITILSGDVHLAAIGQFYSNPKLKIPKHRDHRYMPNVISSAIVNTPPPDMLADVLNKRNKVHHLDEYTDENMIPMFTHDVDDKKRNNTRLLPRRNWCSIREYVPGATPPPTPSTSPSIEDDASFDAHNDAQYQPPQRPTAKRRLSLTKEDFNPRTLMRRISSKGPPPTSFKNNADQVYGERRAASLDGVDRAQASYKQSPQLRASSADQLPDVPALRPTFERRPTNLSERAVQKGVVPAIDPQGNEIHYNDLINLEGGLDIVLNCEINQKDPAGITTQYRLLVPALWYDGSSDREKINAPQQLNKRNTLLKKFGMNARRTDNASDTRGANNQDDGASYTDSYTESEDEKPQQEAPKRAFSIFGSRGKKKPQHIEKSDIQHPHLANKPIVQGDHDNLPRDSDFSNPRDVTAVQQNVGHANNTDISRELNTEPRRSQNSYQAPQQRPQQRPQMSMQQPAQQPAPEFASQRSSQRSSRPLSYTISGAGGPPPLRSEYSSTKAEGRPPYDPDAAYISSQRNNSDRAVQRSNTGGQNYQGRNSGVSFTSDDYAQAPPGQLRGNGIIGKNIPPSSYRDSNSGMHEGESQQVGKGYSGIEAYKDPKPRRRWSLKDRARNIMGSFDSKRRANDDDEWYSNEEEAEYWEGRRENEARR